MANKKKILVALLTFTLTLSFPVTAFAQPKEMPDGEMFDAEFYAQTYQDVYAAFGNDEKALYNHYKTYGKNEGRLPYSNAKVTKSGENSAATKEQMEDAAILQKLEEFKATYPEGTPWNFNNTYKTTSKGRINSGTVGSCQSFAYLVQDYVFGPGKKVKGKATGFESYINNDIRKANGGTWTASPKFYPETGAVGAWEVAGYDGQDPTVNANFEKIYANLRVGDLIQDAYHISMVISKDDTGVTIAEGNFNGKVHYGRRILKESLRRSLIRIETMY